MGSIFSKSSTYISCVYAHTHIYIYMCIKREREMLWVDTRDIEVHSALLDLKMHYHNKKLVVSVIDKTMR